MGSLHRQKYDKNALPRSGPLKISNDIFETQLIRKDILYPDI